MTPSPRAVALAGVAGGLLMLSDAARAQQLEVQVMAVHATTRGPSDEALRPLRARLRRLAGYNAFQVIQNEQRRLSFRTPAAFVLPGGRSLHLLPKGVDDERVMMQVRLLAGRRRLMDTHVRLSSQGTVAFGVGRDGRASNDGALIILLRAEEQPR